MAECPKTSIEFHLDSRSGVPLYLQLVHQVKQALRLGFLVPGDQLLTAREVVSRLAINSNTVFKAYRQLEFEGLVSSRPGIGTFVERSLANESLPRHEILRQQLIEWLKEAEQAGLGRESIESLNHNHASSRTFRGEQMNRVVNVTQQQVPVPNWEPYR